MSTKTIDPSQITTPELHGWLLGAIGPRPIAFASTMDEEGHVNLSPFSFFNVFSANPPILIFSPARRVRGNTTKHTLDNALTTGQVVINVVSYAMVQQMSLASCEYAQGINEFTKAGFTEVASEVVAPPRVKESPVSFECEVTDVQPLGTEGGAGNLIFCEVKRLHIDTSVIDDNGKIDPKKIDLVARMGGNWYARAQGEALFEIPKPLASLGMGIDQLPPTIKNSKVLTGNELAQLAGVDALPQPNPHNLPKEVKAILASGTQVEERLHQLAKGYLAKNNIAQAWQILLACN